MEEEQYPLVSESFKTPPIQYFMICGASGTGKTSWVYHFLYERHLLIPNFLPIRRATIIYKVYQPIYQSIENCLHSGGGLEKFTLLPIEDDTFPADYIVNKKNYSSSGGNLIILDDCTSSIITKKDNLALINLAQVFSHHYKCLVFHIVHSPTQLKIYKTIRENIGVFVLFDYGFSGSLITFLQREMFMYKRQSLYHVYDLCMMRKCRDYLIIQAHPKKDHQLEKLMTGISN